MGWGAQPSARSGVLGGPYSHMCRTDSVHTGSRWLPLVFGADPVGVVPVVVSAYERRHRGRVLAWQELPIVSAVVASGDRPVASC